MPSAVMSLKTRTLSRRHACVRAYIEKGLLYYCTDAVDPPRIVVPHDEDLKYHILYEAHDTAMGGHFGREKTYGMV